MTMTVDDAAMIRTAATGLVDRARAFTITDATTYRAVAEFLSGVKALRGEIAQTFDDHIKRAFEAHRALCREKRDAEAAAVEAETVAKALLVAWDTEQEAAAERERLGLDARAHEDAVNERLDEAVNAACDHTAALIDALLDAPLVVAPVAVVPPVPKVEGLAYRETWSARVTDFAALVAYAAAHPQYLGLLSPDPAALNALARSLRDRLAVPGVVAVKTKSVAARR